MSFFFNLFNNSQLTNVLALLTQVNAKLDTLIAGSTLSAADRATLEAATAKLKTSAAALAASEAKNAPKS